ncbi:hypothetical protein VCR9J2_790075 [Vibrio crassostreae]|nr:hypothetical protein VCR9J2_790075 [Vibrio crassostreae]
MESNLRSHLTTRPSSRAYHAVVVGFANGELEAKWIKSWLAVYGSIAVYWCHRLCHHLLLYSAAYVAPANDGAIHHAATRRDELPVRRKVQCRATQGRVYGVVRQLSECCHFAYLAVVRAVYVALKNREPSRLTTFKT